MTNGMVEAPRAQQPMGSAAALLTAEAFSSKTSDTSEGGTGTGTGGRSPGTAIRRGTGVAGGAGGSAATAAAGNYQVRILTTGNLSTASVRPTSRQKLDLKQMDGTIFTDESSVDSRTNLGYPEEMMTSGGPSKQTGGGRRGGGDSDSEDDLNTRRIPNLSLIDEGNEFDLSQRSITMEEDLLRIGMKKDKRAVKKEGCCSCSVS
jgi:hypothetical protein